MIIVQIVKSDSVLCSVMKFNTSEAFNVLTFIPLYIEINKICYCYFRSKNYFNLGRSGQAPHEACLPQAYNSAHVSFGYPSPPYAERNHVLAPKSYPIYLNRLPTDKGRHGRVLTNYPQISAKTKELVPRWVSISKHFIGSASWNLVEAKT